MYRPSPLPSAGQWSSASCIGAAWPGPVYPITFPPLTSTSVRILFVGISSELFSRHDGTLVHCCLRVSDLNYLVIMMVHLCIVVCGYQI